MPGTLELAQDIYQGNIRVAIPDYIGVREPQYTTGIGILKFAYQNAKIQGKYLPGSVSDLTDDFEKPKRKPKRVKTSNESKSSTDKKKESGIANFFKYFFD